MYIHEIFYFSSTKSNENLPPCEIEETPLSPASDSSYVPPKKSRKQTSDVESELKSPINLYKENVKAEEESDDVIFMKTMANLMKDLPESSKIKIKKVVFNTIMEEKEKFC